ncbi:MAG: response regulator transcription factor [Saprospiraceae bacterium]|nr:response regulator transcription factor [Saprospiraceae bacterium]
MTKFRCLIIDDEPLAHDIILTYVKDISFIEVVGQCYLATEALTFLGNQEIDLIFLDINMPKIKGLDFLRTLHKKPLIIITSAYEEYALESFELDVCDYLLKPFRFDRFLKAVNKALEIHQLKNNQGILSAINKNSVSEEQQQLFIKSDKRFIHIDLAEVYYLESYGNYVKVWLENDFHLAARTLGSFEEQLHNTSFFRIHKSFIINRKYIDYLEGNTLVMKNKKSLPVGKNYRMEIKRFM